MLLSGGLGGGSLRPARRPVSTPSTATSLARLERVAVRAARLPELAADEDEPVARGRARRSPTSVSPTATGRRRACTTFASATPRKRRACRRSPTTSGSETWYAGAGGSKRMSAPTTKRPRRRARARRARDVGLGHEEADREQHQQRARPHGRAAPRARRARGPARSRRPRRARRGRGGRARRRSRAMPSESISAIRFGSIEHVEEPHPERQLDVVDRRRRRVCEPSPSATVLCPSLFSSSAGSVGAIEVDHVLLERLARAAGWRLRTAASAQSTLRPCSAASSPT